MSQPYGRGVYTVQGQPLLYPQLEEEIEGAPPGYAVAAAPPPGYAVTALPPPAYGGTTYAQLQRQLQSFERTPVPARTAYPPQTGYAASYPPPYPLALPPPTLQPLSPQQEQQGTNWLAIIGGAAAILGLLYYVDQQSWAPWRRNRDKETKEEEKKKKKKKKKDEEEEEEEEEEEGGVTPKPTPSKSTIEPEKTPYDRVIAGNASSDPPLDKLSILAYDGDRILGTDQECGVDFVRGKLVALVRRYDEDGKPVTDPTKDYIPHAIRETKIANLDQDRPAEWLWCWLRFPRKSDIVTSDSARSTVVLSIGRSRKDAARTANAIQYSIVSGPSAATIENQHLTAPTLEVRDCKLLLEWKDTSGTTRYSLTLGDLRMPPPPAPFTEGQWYRCPDGRVYLIQDGRRRWIDGPPFNAIKPTPLVHEVDSCDSIRTVPMGPRIL